MLYATLGFIIYDTCKWAQFLPNLFSRNSASSCCSLYLFGELNDDDDNDDDADE